MEIIHIVLGKANPNRLNGVNKVVYQMATEQANAGKNVAVWGITKDTKHDYPPRTFSTILYRSHKFPFFIDKELKKAILSKKEAIYHLHGGWIPVFSPLSSFFKKNKIKYVLTPHGAYNTIAMKRSLWVKKIYFLLLEKKLLKNAHKIHSIGISEVEGLQTIFTNTKSFLLPYGFEIPIPTTKPKEVNGFIIGFVGRIDVYTKGLDILIASFLQFQKKHQNSELWIIGAGDGIAFLEKFIQKNKLNNVTLFGKKFGEEKNTLIQQMTVFAHPSRNEGLPTSVLEAASFGIPSVVTKATNIANFIDQYNAGISIESASVPELVQAFETMYNRKEYNYSLACTEMLKEQFSWSVLVDKYDKLYL